MHLAAARNLRCQATKQRASACCVHAYVAPLRPATCHSVTPGQFPLATPTVSQAPGRRTLVARSPSACRSLQPRERSPYPTGPISPGRPSSIASPRQVRAPKPALRVVLTAAWEAGRGQAGRSTRGKGIGRLGAQYGCQAMPMSTQTVRHQHPSLQPACCQGSGTASVSAGFPWLDRFKAPQRKGKERNATGKSPHLRCDLHAVVKAVGGAGVEACTRAEGGWAVAAEQQLESPQLASTAGS